MIPSNPALPLSPPSLPPRSSLILYGVNEKAVVGRSEVWGVGVGWRSFKSSVSTASMTTIASEGREMRRVFQHRITETAALTCRIWYCNGGFKSSIRPDGRTRTDWRLFQMGDKDEKREMGRARKRPRPSEGRGWPEGPGRSAEKGFKMSSAWPPPPSLSSISVSLSLSLPLE